MHAHVVFRAPDGRTARLGHGDLIGRIRNAALQLDDPRVSEAHALVSLRGTELKLLALRGRLGFAGRRCTEVDLVAGREVLLAPDLALQIVAVELPDVVLALEGPGLTRQVLAGVCSLSVRPLALVPRFKADADAWFWQQDEGWTAMHRDGTRVSVIADTDLVVGGVTLRAIQVPLDGTSATTTRQTAGFAAPLRVVAHWDTVEIHPDGGDPVVLSGVAARLVSELASLGGPVSWQVLAREVWSEGDPALLRHRLDVTLSRIRSRLKRGGIRSDLVLTDGAGSLELLLAPGDVVEDRT